MVLAVATVFDVVGVRALLFTQQAGELSAAEGGRNNKNGRVISRNPSSKINSTKVQKAHGKPQGNTSSILSPAFLREHKFSVQTRRLGRRCQAGKLQTCLTCWLHRVLLKPVTRNFPSPTRNFRQREKSSACDVKPINRWPLAAPTDRIDTAARAC